MSKNINLLFLLFLSISFCCFSSQGSTTDYYIDRVTGKKLGRDGSNTKKLRVIDRREWDYVRKEKGGVRSKQGTKELHNNSYIITYNEQQIQDEIQLLADDTVKDNLEHQLYIVLDVNSGRIFAKRELDLSKIFKMKAIIKTYSLGKESAPRVAEGLMLLAQVHGHPKIHLKNTKNYSTVSGFDKRSAQFLGITIFAIDAFDLSKPKGYARAIHRVTKNGKIRNFIGQTKGENRENTFNFSIYFFDMLKKGRYR